MTLHIDRHSGVTAWAQIADHLSGQIRGGALAAGAKLPTEQALARSMDVNRHTIRRALAALETAGLVRTVQGSGTFVRDHVVDYAVGERTRFSESLAPGPDRPAQEATRRFVGAMSVAADAATAKALAIRKGAKVVRVRLLGSVNGRPISLADHIFAEARFGGIDRDIAETLSITEALRRHGVADYQRKSTRITAHMPDAEEADLLELPRTRPVLQTESANVDSDGAVIEYGLARFAADRIQLVVDT